MRSFKKVETFTISQKHTTQVYLREVSKIPIMTAEEEYVVALQAAQGDVKAIQKLVSANLRFVLSVAKMYAATEEAQQEMVAVGNVGLVDAAYMFDPTKGFKFISFAVWHIRKEMILWLQKHKRTVYVPPAQIQIVKKAEQVKLELYGKLDREPTSLEIYECLQTKEKDLMTFENFELFLSNQLSISSLDQPLESGEDSTFYDILDSQVFNPQQEYEKQESQTQLGKLLETLIPVEREIVEMRFGVNCLFPHGFPEISKKMGLKTDQIERIHRNAMTKLKQKVRKLNWHFGILREAKLSEDSEI